MTRKMLKEEELLRNELKWGNGAPYQRVQFFSHWSKVSKLIAALRARLALAEKVAVEARIYLYGPSNGATGPLRAALDAAKEGT